MTEPEARVVLERLSRIFAVPCPDLIWIPKGERQVRGWYRGRIGSAGTIEAGDGTWRGAEATLLHEFTHHLVRHRYHGLYGNDNGYHGHYFMQLLIQVLDYYREGDRQNYPWCSEYMELRKRVQRRRISAWAETTEFIGTRFEHGVIDVNKQWKESA